MPVVASKGSPWRTITVPLPVGQLGNEEGVIRSFIIFDLLISVAFKWPEVELRILFMLSEGKISRLPRAAVITADHLADRNAFRLERFANFFCVGFALIAELSLSCTVIEAHVGVSLIRVVGFGCRVAECRSRARPPPGVHCLR